MTEAAVCYAIFFCENRHVFDVYKTIMIAKCLHTRLVRRVTWI